MNILKMASKPDYGLNRRCMIFNALINSTLNFTPKICSLVCTLEATTQFKYKHKKSEIYLSHR